MFVVLFFHVFWKLGGFLLSNVIGGVYGLRDVTDAYTIAINGVVFALYLIVEESMGPSFLPVFIYGLKEDGDTRAWRFANTAFSLLFVALCVTVFLGMLYTTEIIDFWAPGFLDKGRLTARAHAITLMGIAFPGLFGLALGSLTYVALNAYKTFGYPAAGDALQKFAWVAVVALLAMLFREDPKYIAYGFIAGSLVKISTHLVGLRDKLHLMRFSIHLRTPDMKRYMMLLGPLLLGIVAAKLRDLITKAIGTYLEEGQLSSIEWAKKVGDFPVLILPYALSIAMFPYLCEMAKERDYKQFAAVVTNALKMLAMFFLPVTVGAIVMRTHVIAFLYDWGKWSDSNTYWTSLALGFYAVALVFYASEAILMQSFFSMQNTWIPVSVGLVASSLQIAGLYVAVSVLGVDRFYCVALAFPISRALKNIVLGGLMRRKVPILPGADTARFLLKMVLLCAAVGGAMCATEYFLGDLLQLGKGSRGLLNARVAARLMLSSLSGVAAFAAAAYALRLEEAASVLSWLRGEGWGKIKEKLFPGS